MTDTTPRCEACGYPLSSPTATCSQCGPLLDEEYDSHGRPIEMHEENIEDDLDLNREGDPAFNGAFD